MQKQHEITEATIQGRERQKVTKRLKTGNISKVYASAKALHKYHTDNQETDKANNILNNTIKPIENGYQSYKDSFSRKSNTVQKVKDKVNDAMSKFNDADEKYTDHLNKYKINTDALSDIHKKNKYKKHLYTLEPVGMGVSDVAQARERTSAVVKGLGAPFRAIGRLLGFKQQQKVAESALYMLNMIDSTYLEEKNRNRGRNRPGGQQDGGQQQQQQQQHKGKYHEERQLLHKLEDLHYHAKIMNAHNDSNDHIDRMMNTFHKAIHNLSKAHMSKGEDKETYEKNGKELIEHVKSRYKKHLKDHKLNEHEVHRDVKSHQIGYRWHEGPMSIYKSKSSDDGKKQRQQQNESLIKSIENKDFYTAKQLFSESINSRINTYFEEGTSLVIDSVFNEAKKKRKPDYLDFDGDGNEKESMKKALKDKMMKNESNDPIGSLIKILKRGDLNPGAPKTTPPTPTKKPLSVKMKSVATTNKPTELRQPDPKDYDKALY